jgi:biotin transport system substrate-specific component
MNHTSTKKLTTYQLTLTALMTAVTCILGPMSLAIPISPVPISFTNLVVYLTVCLLGTKLGTISYLIYLLLGLVGLPVFSGFTGGVGKLFGPTGGYLFGFIFMAVICGIFYEKFPGKGKKDCILQVAGMILATAVAYLFGTLWLARVAGMAFYAALGAGVIPFIPGDLAKIVIVALVGPAIRTRLVRAGLLG